MKPVRRWLAVIPTLTLLISCSSPQAEPSPNEPSPTRSAPTMEPTSANPSTPPDGADTANWKSFESFNISFRYPPNWVIRADDDDPSADPKNPYRQWEIVTDRGFAIATFETNSAKDTDGDTDRYERTRLETREVAADLHTPAVFVAEQYVKTEPGNAADAEKKIVLFLSTTDRAQQRGSGPELSYFMPRADFYSIFESTEDFAQAAGFDDDSVDLAAAREIMQSEVYWQLREIMLSVTSR
ncbi:hypothetical protein GCM10027417_28420 [Glutamicibacter endophyticus]